MTYRFGCIRLHFNNVWIWNNNFRQRCLWFCLVIRKRSMIINNESLELRNCEIEETNIINHKNAIKSAEIKIFFKVKIFFEPSIVFNQFSITVV